MKASFLILEWYTANGRERARAIEQHICGPFACISNSTHSIVLSRQSRPYNAAADTMLLLGHVFGNANVPSEGCVATRLRALTNNVWGRYTAFARSDDSAYVMVDPSGAGRAYLVQDDELAMVADHLDPALMSRAGFAIDVDVSALTGCLLDPGTMVMAPLLRGVTAMVPGRAYSLGRDGDTIEIWSPVSLAFNDSRDAGAVAAYRLRAAVDHAVSTMVGTKRPLIELSGGLDSSILAGTMTALGIRASAVTVTAIGGDVDELRYAEATAKHARMPLHRGRTATYPKYATFMEAEQVAHPFIFGVDDAFADIIRATAGDGIDRIVTGQGGDAVFFQPATPLTTIDRYRACGWRSGWSALLDDARRTRSSVWHHIGPVVSDLVRGTPALQDELAGGLLTADALAHRKRFEHPWCANARHLPPGRQLQMLMLANCSIFHSAQPIDLGRPQLHPLLSQPVIESVLAIPTWQLASGPLDRGLARRAFADRLHHDITARRSKGEAAAYYSRAAVANLPYLRERLLDGALAKSGIIDRCVMEQALTAEYLFYSLDYRALILHAACEAWLSAWTQAPVRASCDPLAAEDRPTSWV